METALLPREPPGAREEVTGGQGRQRRAPGWSLQVLDWTPAAPHKIAEMAWPIPVLS